MKSRFCGSLMHFACAQMVEVEGDGQCFSFTVVEVNPSIA